MRKLMLLFGIMVSLVFGTVNAEERTRAEIQLRTDQELGSRVNRAPMMLPTIFVVYEPMDRTVEVECSMNIDATVTLYDHNGNVIDFGTDINSVLSIPDFINGKVTVLIQSEHWQAIADIFNL